MPKKPASTTPKKAPARKPATRSRKSSADAVAAKVEKIEAGQKLSEIKLDAYGNVNTKDAAFLIGKTPPTLVTWRNKKNCPAVHAGGSVDMPKLIEWMIEQETAPLRAQIEAMEKTYTKDENGPTMQQLQLRNMQGDNVKQGIQIREMLKDFLPRQLVFHQISTIYSEIMTRLRPMGTKLGPRVSVESDPTICTQLIDEELNAILVDLNAATAIEGRKEKDIFEQADEEAEEAYEESLKELEDE